MGQLNEQMADAVFSDSKNIMMQTAKEELINQLDNYKFRFQSLLGQQGQQTDASFVAQMELECYNFQQFLLGRAVDTLVIYNFKPSLITEGNNNVINSSIHPINRYELKLTEALQKYGIQDSINTLTAITKELEENTIGEQLERHFNQLMQSFQVAKNEKNKILYTVHKEIANKYSNLRQKNGSLQVFNMGHIVEAFEHVYQQKDNETPNKTLTLDTKIRDTFFRNLHRDSVSTYRQGDINWTQIKFYNGKLLNEERVKKQTNRIIKLIDHMKSQPISINDDKLKTLLKSFLPKNETLLNNESGVMKHLKQLVQTLNTTQ